MNKVIVVNGSPRKDGNSDILAQKVVDGARDEGADVELIYAADLSIKPCTGCLRCNLVKRCALRGDDFPVFAKKLTSAFGVVFVTPIYFHWMSSQLKTLIDRCRSLTHVKILPHSLVHTPYTSMPEQYGVISVLGAPVEDDALPVMEFFRDFAKMFKGKVVSEMVCTKLAVRKQVAMTEEVLSETFRKMDMDPDLAMPYAQIYLSYLMRAEQMGRTVARRREKPMGPDWL
jgi:hypothetical protein